ncbi:restriction endonuclease [Paucibacter sp. B51]|uniref:restriction endonuclease n=1 Tax=Paucibacter sp. B51 TaxID=2993315 RepID=UPI0022EBBC3A|nr:restriction endonuclease [Paucibacter sp. B51]
MTSNSKTMWMVRAGEAGWRFDEFERESIVSIGWHEMGDLTALQGRDAFMRQVELSYPKAKPSTYPSSAGQVFRFVREIKVGDSVLTYSPPQRSYLVGVVEGTYEYAPAASAEQPNQRKVRWLGRVMRDNLSVATRNSLGAISTLFMVPAEAAAEIERFLSGTAPAVMSTPAAPDVEEQVDDLYKDIQGKAFEFIKDKVSQLDWEDMQELVAGLLRAMGYKTRISPSGSDRGKDIVASPDGLGFEDPRIVVEVKHRTAAMGSQEIRSFLGGRHDNDKGLYVSTGGFTKDARYEAERARIPVTLMDLDDLVKALLEQYERMDIDMQRLIPMRKLYWPA